MKNNFRITYIKTAGFLLVLSGLVSTINTQAQATLKDTGVSIPAYHGHFSELPVGAVQPRGWIKSWLERQGEGMTGHPENLGYPYNTHMLAGEIPPPAVKHGQDWWPYEQSGYMVDGIVRLNRQIENADICRLTSENLGYLRKNSGPNKFGASVWGWPNAVIGRALMAEDGVENNPAYRKVLTEYFSEYKPWHSRDGYVFEQALYLYALTGYPELLDFAKEAYNRFFIDDPDSFSHRDKIKGTAPIREHGVTTAEQFKLLPMYYCATGDKEVLEFADEAFRKVENASLMPDGGMVSSENLGTPAFNSLHETCNLTDWSWSMGYMLMAGGDPHWADIIEQTIFNALPGAVTKDFKQLQYFSSVNQILASNTACPRIAPTRMSYRAAHDTECCSGNVNRAMPNYVARMWLKTTGGIAAALYGPSEVNTVIDGHPVKIIQETDYPFRETVTFKIDLERAATFALDMRIPEWCSGAKVKINGRDGRIQCKAGSFISLKRKFRDGDIVELYLPMAVKFDKWFADKAVTLQRGPLVYSLAIENERREHSEDTRTIKGVLKGNDIAGFPAVEYFPTGEWRYGLDPSVMATPEKLMVIEMPVTENPFIPGEAPVLIEIPLRHIPLWESAWKPYAAPGNTDIKAGPHNPADLPDGAVLREAGPAKVFRLVPYGATYLRLTTFPLVL